MEAILGFLSVGMASMIFLPMSAYPNRSLQPRYRTTAGLAQWINTYMQDAGPVVIWCAFLIVLIAP